MSALDDLLNMNLAIGIDEYYFVLEKAKVELVILRKELEEAEDYLLDMVNQYMSHERNGKLTYSHDFMSLGESLFPWLVAHNMADWYEDGIDTVSYTHLTLPTN